jgi:putative ABC transport system permease protein
MQKDVAPSLQRLVRRYDDSRTNFFKPMILNHIKVAFRNLRKQRVYNALNVLGLASGMAAGLLIALHIQEELSYEKSFPNYKNIYRAHEVQWAKSCPPLAIEMKERLPNIAAIGRFAYYGTRVVNTDANNPGEVRGYYADSTVFDVFNFKIVAGDRKQVLMAAKTAVITQSMAKRYFADQDPIGKLLHFDNNQDFPITAVIEDVPGNSHIQFDYLISMPTFYQDVPDKWSSSKGWMVTYTYVRFKSDQDYQKARTLMPGFIRGFYEGDENVEKLVKDEEIRLQPLADIHLTSHNEQEMSANSDIIYVYIFVAVEILMLIVASANFMSLFTTQAMRRMKEVGVRKILGAQSRQVMGQFLTEVVLLMAISLLVSIVLYQLALPFYNNITGKTLGVWEVFEWKNVSIIAIMLIVIIGVSGVYPAFFISGFKSGSFLQEHKLPNSIPNKVRNGLVVFQFAVSLSLIAASILVNRQMNLLQTKDLGFDKEQVIQIKLYGSLYEKATKDPQVFRNEFLRNPNVLSIGRVGDNIGSDLSVETVVPEGREQDKNLPSVRVLRVDEGYLTTMQIPLVAGRNFSQERNDTAAFIINETAARVLGIDHPVDQRLTNATDERAGKIIGVVKDYHFASLRSKVEPLVIEWRPEWTGLMLVKVKAGAIPETLKYLDETTHKIVPGSLFVYSFLDDRLNQQYISEQAMGKIFEFFSILAVIIACLGLLGLSAFTIESRTKEIGIRKVLGATVTGILGLIGMRFIILIASAFVISVPLTWYGMHRWLQNFAYQTDIPWWVFATTFTIVFVIAILTVGFNTIRAAVRNPVRSLRYE